MAGLPGKPDSPSKKPKLTSFTAEQLAEITRSTEFQTALATQVATTLQTSLEALLPVQLAPALAQQAKDIQAMLDEQDKSLEGKFAELRASLAPAPASAAAAATDHDKLLDRLSDLEALTANIPLSSASSAAGPSTQQIEELVAKSVDAKLASTPNRTPRPSLDGQSTPRDFQDPANVPSFGNSPATPVASWAERLRLSGASHSPYTNFVSTPISTSHGPSTGTAFERDLDLTILKINTKSQCTKVEMAKVVTIILKDALTSVAEFDIEGLETGEKFVVRIRGSPDSAAAVVRKVLAAQRLGAGEFRRYKCVTPVKDGTGSSAYTDVYLNGDKNSKMVKTEIACKKVIELLRTRHAAMETKGKPSVFQVGNKLEGKICCSWKPIARVRAVDNDNVELDWDKSKATEAGIDYAAVDADFRKSDEGGETKWERV